MPVIPATWKGKAGIHLAPGIQTSQGDRGGTELSLAQFVRAKFSRLCLCSAKLHSINKPKSTKSMPIYRTIQTVTLLLISVKYRHEGRPYLENMVYGYFVNRKGVGRDKRLEKKYAKIQSDLDCRAVQCFLVL